MRSHSYLIRGLGLSFGCAILFATGTVLSGVSSDTVNSGLGPQPESVQRINPKAAVTGFLDACQRGQFDLAAYYLDLRGIALERQPRDGARLARRLFLALHRSVWIEPDTLTESPRGEGIGGQEQISLASVKLRNRQVELGLTRHGSEGVYIWTFSPETVASIDAMYARFGYGWLGDRAPVVLFSTVFAGLQLWQWLALCASLLLGFIISWQLGRVGVRVALRVARRTSTQWDDAVIKAMKGPVGIVLWSGLLAASVPWLGLGPDERALAQGFNKLLALIGVGWFLVRLVDGMAGQFRQENKTEDAVSLGFMPVLVRFGKTMVVILIGLAALDLLGVKVLALLGGLGIGALAVAFAAQKTLENVFGTVAIASDRPFKIGDFVTIGQDSGTVEDVGFRSTSLRTMARTLVTIPNGVVVAGRVENLTARDRIIFNPVLNLAYGISAEQIKQVTAGIARLISEHAMVFQAEKRVRFRGFGETGVLIEVLCWVMSREMDEFTRVAEELNLAITELVENAGCSFVQASRILAIKDESRTPLKN